MFELRNRRGLRKLGAREFGAREIGARDSSAADDVFAGLDVNLAAGRRPRRETIRRSSSRVCSRLPSRCVDSLKVRRRSGESTELDVMHDPTLG